MDKVAQKLKPLTKLREKINAPTETLMGAFSPEFVKLMEVLRQVDENVRENSSELKDLLKLIKTNFNRREYMTAISLLGRFHDKMKIITDELATLGKEVNMAHHGFLFGDMDKENIDFLKTLAPKFEKYKKPVKKEAGITDWWHNLTSDRGKALRSWEKRFPRESKELKRQTASIIIKSESLYSNLITTLKLLGTFRATRKLEEYIKTAEKFDQRYKAYNDAFANFYNTYIDKFIKLQEAQEQNKEEKTQQQAPLSPIVPAGQPLFNKKLPETPLASAVAPAVSREKLKWPPAKQDVESRLAQGLEKLPKQHLEPEDLTESDATIVENTQPDATIENTQKTEQTTKQTSIEKLNAQLHDKFLKKLASLDQNNSFAIAAEIILYANKIKNTNPIVSEKLIQISNKLLSE